MIWLLLRLTLFGVVLAAPHPRTQEAELSYLMGLTLFDLLWLLQRRLPELRMIASLVFTLILGATSLIYLVGGSLVSLAFFWPSLMLRLENCSPGQQRLGLILLQVALVVTAPVSDFPLEESLRLPPVLFSLLQLRPGRISSWANAGTLLWMLGMLVPAYLFSADLTATALARNLLLLSLPQLALKSLNRD